MAEGRRRVVAEAYRNTRGPVAFLDETYQLANSDITVVNTFYVLTAVVVELDQMDELRTGLRQIARGDWWHTTQALLEEEGRARAEDMLSFLGEGIEPCVIAAQVPIDSTDGGGEIARRACYRGIAAELATQGRVSAPVDLLVLEERNQRALRGRDERNHRELIADRLVPRGTRLLQTSPSAECLLWLPDLVSSAYRRSITHSDRTSKLFEIIRDQVRFVDALT